VVFRAHFTGASVNRHIRCIVGSVVGVVLLMLVAMLDARQLVLTNDLAALRRIIAEGGSQLEQAVTLLMVAVRSGSEDTVAFLLEAGVDPNGKTENGETALMFGSGVRRAAVVRALIGAGARVNERDDQGMTALHHALDGTGERRHLTEVVQLLLEAGANATIRDGRGRTPRDVARHREWRLKLPLVGWELRGW